MCWPVQKPALGKPMLMCFHCFKSFSRILRQKLTLLLPLLFSCRHGNCLNKLQLKVVQLASNMSASETKTALTGLPDILVSTPACVKNCLLSGTIKATDIRESLSVLILDEANLLLSYGYEDDLKAITAHVPKRCQCLLMSANSSDDVEKLKKLILHNPYILTLPEVGNVKDDIIPKNVQQFYVSNCQFLSKC